MVGTSRVGTFRWHATRAHTSTHAHAHARTRARTHARTSTRTRTHAPCTMRDLVTGMVFGFLARRTALRWGSRTRHGGQESYSSGPEKTHDGFTKLHVCCSFTCKPAAPHAQIRGTTPPDARRPPPPPTATACYAVYRAVPFICVSASLFHGSGTAAHCRMHHRSARVSQQHRVHIYFRVVLGAQRFWYLGSPSRCLCVTAPPAVPPLPLATAQRSSWSARASSAWTSPSS